MSRCRCRSNSGNGVERKIALEFTDNDVISIAGDCESEVTVTGTTTKPPALPVSPSLSSPTDSANPKPRSAGTGTGTDDSTAKVLLKMLASAGQMLIFLSFLMPVLNKTSNRFGEIESRIAQLQSEVARHGADGLGRADYALAAGSELGGGGAVVKHSEPYGTNSWFNNLKGGGVHGDAVKMLRPSFGEPGECFPLKGDNGFVQIKLRTPIVPEAVTLEHVDKSVAYERANAPKDCKVYGWLSGQEAGDVITEADKMFLLNEFSYDIGKSNIQTFDVTNMMSSDVVDMIRLEFTSNHGNPSNTCIYRLRVHGHGAISMPKLEAQPNAEFASYI